MSLFQKKPIERHVIVTEEDIKTELFDLLVERLSIDIDNNIALNSRFVEDLGADSLDIIEIIMGIEDIYDIEIPDEDSAKLFTIGEAIEYIKQHLSQQVE